MCLTVFNNKVSIIITIICSREEENRETGAERKLTRAALNSKIAKEYQDVIQDFYNEEEQGSQMDRSIVLDSLQNDYSQVDNAVIWSSAITVNPNNQPPPDH